MKTTILNLRAKRDELLLRPYQQRHTKYDASEHLQNTLIKLITGPRRVGKSVFALLMLQGKNFAYLNFDDNRLLEKWDEDLAMSALQVCYDMTSEKTRKRELDALVEAADELHCNNLLVITNLHEEKIEWKDKMAIIKLVNQY